MTIYKTCLKCGESKLLTDFYNDKNAKSGKYSRCKECIKVYRELDKKEIKEYQELHKKEIKEYQELHKKEIKEYQELHKEEIREQQKEHRNIPKDGLSDRIHNQNRRAQKRGVGGDGITPAQIEYLLKIQSNKCNICGVKFTKMPYTVDHIVPISKEGEHDDRNIQLLCRSCNSSKHTKLDYGYIQTWGHFKNGNI